MAEKYNVACIVHSGVELLRMARDLRPQVLVTEIDLPQVSGLEVATILKQEGNLAKIIVFTMQAEIDSVLQAFCAGVAGYATKNDEGAELMFALREVLAGRTYISPYVAKVVVKSWMGAVQSRGSTSDKTLFTPRQIEVLKLIVQGKTMKEVASILGISSRTAEVHKYQMMDRLGVRTVPELIQRAIRSGVAVMSDV